MITREQMDQMTEIEQIEHAIQWIEDGALLDGNLYNVPVLLTDEVERYCSDYLWNHLRYHRRDEATVEQVSRIVGFYDFDDKELSEDLRSHLSDLSEWLQDMYEELKELHEDIMEEERES